jgi:hypothetical protein
MRPGGLPKSGVRLAEERPPAYPGAPIVRPTNYLS